eukprot:4286912-Ditylum_brightwellii.AAC.1
MNIRGGGDDLFSEDEKEDDKLNNGAVGDDDAGAHFFRDQSVTSREGEQTHSSNFDKNMEYWSSDVKRMSMQRK